MITLGRLALIIAIARKIRRNSLRFLGRCFSFNRNLLLLLNNITWFDSC